MADLHPLRLPDLSAPLQMKVHDSEDQHVSRDIREQGVWEPYESSLVLSWLDAGDCFVDVGANIGYFTLLGAQRVGSGGTVFAFEPEPRNFALLCENLQLNQLAEQVSAVPAALAATEGRADLYLNPDNLGDHQLHPDEEGRSRVEVQLFRGSDYLRGRIDRIDVLKVDTQGSEYQVIDGLMPLLCASGARLRILLELTPFSLRAAGSSGAQLVRLLERLQLPFAIVDHIEHRLVSCTADELCLWSDNTDACEDDRGFMNIMLGAH